MERDMSDKTASSYHEIAADFGPRSKGHHAQPMVADSDAKAQNGFCILAKPILVQLP